MHYLINMHACAPSQAFDMLVRQRMAMAEGAAKRLLKEVMGL